MSTNLILNTDGAQRSDGGGAPGKRPAGGQPASRSLASRVFGEIPNLIGSHLVKNDNPRVSCPPGRIEPREGPLVLVATMMRAGTHVMIDSLLNNFEALRASPLYVNVDEILRRPDAKELTERLDRTGGYVIKTHYPQFLTESTIDQKAYMESLARRARVITVDRDPAESFKSTQAWIRAGESALKPINMESMKSARDWAAYEAAYEEFKAFWSAFPVLSIDYRRLIKASEFPGIMAEVADWIGLEPRATLVPPLPKDAKRRVYVAKALTRLIGRRAPLINTTIRFAKS